MLRAHAHSFRCEIIPCSWSLTRYPRGGGAAGLARQQQASREREKVVSERLTRNIGRANERSAATAR